MIKQIFQRRHCRAAAVLLIIVSARIAVGDDGSETPRPSQADQSDVAFNRDVRPILADRCFTCHGPDEGEREGDLRLDLADHATADRGGYRAIVPGDAAASEIIERLTTDDPDLRMPPAETGKSLTPEQIALIRRWIEQGAKYEEHWSLLPPTRPVVPEAMPGQRALNPIDHFVHARLREERLRPSAAADKRTLIRRLYFDLLGLPPTPEEVAAFSDDSPRAYENLVDRLLASPHFGERMALYWLDLVRYADTNGIHGDNHREHAPYRDYVIQAFNDNMPFDRFTIEQLAGDLLPSATTRQKVASGYNRLNMTTREGGAQAKEYTAKYAADRVRNASTVWLGATLGCAECHDHKFDPYTAKDFYSFASFFADVRETAVGTQQPVNLPTPDQEMELTAVEAKLAELKGELEKPRPELADAQAAWESEVLAKLDSDSFGWIIARPESAASNGGATLAVLDDASVLTSGKNPAKDTYELTLPIAETAKLTGVRLEALTHPSLTNGGLSRANGNFVLTRFDVELQDAAGESRPVKLAAAEADFEQNGFPIAHAIDGKADTGWAVSGHERKNESRTAAFRFDTPQDIAADSTLVVRLHHESQYGGHNIGRFRLSLTQSETPALNDSGLPADLVAALKTPAADRTPAQQSLVVQRYRQTAPELASLRNEIGALERRVQAIRDAFPPILISMSGPPRTVRILPRGNWLDDSGPIVEPAVPEFLGKLAAEDRATRLDLAHWLVDPQNPLVARVFVNRLWKLMFGNGIVTTLDDFGAQGTWPTHPELLDWLAIEFIDSGWNVKHMLKLMAMSASYQQSSLESPELRSRDPYNRLLARQSRFRLEAEMVRDLALTTSGLLVPKIGGPSVKPYQPAGYWSHLNFPKREYENDSGESQYRRGLYTYWCRTFLHPSLLAFDAPSREECAVERPRSNTPLAALVLLNDPTYVEASRVFAERILRDGGESTTDRIAFAYRQVLSRTPSEEEVDVLSSLVVEHQQQYEADPPAADKLLSVGQHPASGDLNRAELAAWTNVARAILNLHETITRN